MHTGRAKRTSHFSFSYTVQWRLDMAKRGKVLLSNFIRHANTHNRIREERMMWQQREMEQSREDICPGWSERRPRRAPLARGHLVSDVRSSGEDRDSDGPRVESDTHSPNYWTRKLVKAEESDPYRWGHGGYKEQHPEEFVSSEEDQSDTSATLSKKSKKRKRKRVSSDSSPPTKKRKKSKKEKKHQSTSKRKKRRKLKTKRTVSSSESSTSEDA